MNADELQRRSDANHKARIDIESMRKSGMAWTAIRSAGNAIGGLYAHSINAIVDVYEWNEERNKRRLLRLSLLLERDL